MAITLTESELLTLQRMSDQALPGSYWQIYEWLANKLEENGVAGSDSTVLWLRGATEANAGRGAMSAMIREYTQTQNELRYGIRLSMGQMQEASDAVAKSLLKDLLGGNAPRWPRGLVPDITRIAEADATAVGETLFNTVGDTSAAPTNSAWSGTLLFSLLRSDQAGRLMSTGTAGAIDTLNDLRDVLYAFAAYAEGFKAARAQFLIEGALGQNTQQFTDLLILGKTSASYLQGTGTPESLKSAMLAGTDNPVLREAFRRIEEVGASRLLDMLKGAMQGKAVIGTTTDDNFVQNAHAHFGGLSAARMQSLKVDWLPADAASLAARAAVDVNVRAALAGLSIVSVQVDADVAARLSLYDPNTGIGEITEAWIRDRAAMTSQVARSDWASTKVMTGQGVEANAQYIDIASGAKVLIGAVLPQQRAQIVFGDQAANTLTGYGLADRLYGGADNDTLSGQGGNDHLEGHAGNDSLDGGAGTDTLLGGAGDDVLLGGTDNDDLRGGAGNDIYRFTSGWGADTIVDADGKGSIEVEGLGPINGSGADKVAEGVWQTADKKVNYTLVSVDAQRNDLLITFSDRPDVIRIQNWSQDKGVGITLEQTLPTVSDFSGEAGNRNHPVGLLEVAQSARHFAVRAAGARRRLPAGNDAAFFARSAA